MIIIFSIFFTIAFCLLGKFIFKKWFNHLSLYTIIWGITIILYELRLINYIQISIKTWLIIIVSFLCFLLGIMMVITNKERNAVLFNSDHSIIFSDGGKIIKYLIIIFSIIGTFAALQHWYLLINKYGSIPAVLIKMGLIYRERVMGESVGEVPYLFIFSYAGVFLSSLYTAYKNKLTFVAILPLIGVILKDLAIVGRAGTFFGFLLFLTVFFLYKHSVPTGKQTQKITKRSIIIAIAVITILMGASAIAVKTFRGTFEDFKASSKSLDKLQKNVLISPSIYLYFSSSVGVLSKYFYHEDEQSMIGENSFLPIYNLLAKFEYTKKPSVYQKGYFVPMWTNNGTYLRELHADFGYFGVFIVPFLLGLFSTYYWYQFYEHGNLYSLIILSFLYMIIFMSIFLMVTRMAIWFLTPVFLLITVSLMRAYFIKSSKVISNN